jgi:hypothetical protein
MSRADNLTIFMCRLSSNLRVSTSLNPQDLYRPVQGLIYLYLYKLYQFDIGLYIFIHKEVTAFRQVRQKQPKRATSHFRKRNVKESNYAT